MANVFEYLAKNIGKANVEPVNGPAASANNRNQNLKANPALVAALKKKQEEEEKKRKLSTGDMLRKAP